MSDVKQEPSLSASEIFDKAAKSAMRGGTAGACAMGANVALLMWMRTTVSLYSKRRHESRIFISRNFLLFKLLRVHIAFVFLLIRSITNTEMELVSQLP